MTIVKVSRRKHQHKRRQVGNPIIAIIDLISLLIGSYGIYMNIMKTQLPEYFANAGHWQFLTNLALVYSLIVFLLGFIAHLIKSNWLFELKNNFHPIGLALETIVTIIYWPLRLFFLPLLAHDPDVFHLPLLTDLSIHFMPVISLLIDYLIFMPRWKIKNHTAAILVVNLTVMYWYLLEYLVDIENGAKYPYAFMDVDSVYHRMIIFSVIALIAFLQFLFLRKVYDWIVETTEEIDSAIDRKFPEKDD